VRAVNDRRAIAALCLGAALALPWTLHAQTAPADPPPAAAEPAPPAATTPPAATNPTAPVMPQTPAPPTAVSPPSAKQPLLTPPGAPVPTPGTAPEGAYVARPVHFDKAPVIDGNLDDDVWKTAARLGDFRQLEPKEGEPATEPTEVFLGYDNDNLYIAARCHDSEPGKIVTTTLTRDSDMNYDDTLQILLDTFHDGRSAFLFLTNAGGVKVDGLVRNEGEQVNLDWDGLWMVEGRRDAEGWTTEIAIPWRTLRFPNVPEQLWGFNVEREVARKQERTFWKPVEHSWYARYKVSQAGTLVGMQGVHPGRRYHIAPYVIAGAERPDDGSGTSSVTRAGGDVKINLASDLVANLTVRTDFSETEADEQDVNLTRDPLLFPEKRGFFLEGANLFYFGQRPDPEHTSEYFLFHSRQIGLTPDGRTDIPVLGGVKVTGHEKGFDIAALSLETQRTRKSDGFGGRVDEPRTNWSVLRLKRDLGHGSTVGVIGLSKAAPGDQNRVGGADWDITINENLRTGGYFAKSHTPGIEKKDYAGSADLYWDSRNWRFHQEYTEIGQGFNDELGYISRTGVRFFRTDDYRIFWPESGPFKQAWFVYDLDYITDLATGDLQTRINHGKFSAFFRDSSGIAYKIYDELEVLKQPLEIKQGLFIPAGSYHFLHHFFGFQTDYTKPLGGAGRLAWGDYYDGHFVQAFGYVSYRPVPGFQFAATWQRTDVHLKEGDFVNDIALAQIDYAFSNRLATRLWLQWDKGANLRGKFDVDWEFRPGSRLFVVYQDIRSYIDFFDPRQPVFGTPGRQLITKVVYLF
jgi:hypothetical protein